MASINDTSLAFFNKATPEQFAYVLGLYRDVFAVHAEQTRGAKKNGPAELIKLDNWYQHELPQIIRSRKEHQLIYEEIVQVTKWKLLRGKFRPSLLDLVKTNTETAVKNTTKKAFRKLPDISLAITALTQLKGIGPATASAILVAYSPDLCPYMADESMLSVLDTSDLLYTTKEYMNYVEKIEECLVRLREQDSSGEWNPHKIELALWTHYQIKQYNLDLLSNMPIVEVKANQDDESTNADLNQDSDLNREANLENNEVNVEDREISCRKEQEISNSDENQVESTVDSSQNYEIDLNCSSNIDTSNSNLIDNSTNNGDSSQNQILSSNNGNIDVSQSDSESLSNGLSSSSHILVTNSESNLDHVSYLSSNSLDESIQLNKVASVGSVEEDSSSNNVSSTNLTNLNGISQSTSKSTENYKLKNLITNGGKLSASTTSDELINNDNQINSSLINQNFIIIQDNPQNNVDSNLSLSLPSTISSSCENSNSHHSNNVNLSEDSIQLLNHKKRSNSSSNSSLSNLSKQRTCVNNCNDALDLDDCNAVPDSDSLSKRQKLIN